MKSKALIPWVVEVDDVLLPTEQFAGITEATFQDKDEKIFQGLIGLVENWDTASGPSSRRYVNIKFKKYGQLGSRKKSKQRS